MSLEAGPLRHRVTIERQVQTTDPVEGTVDVTWQVHCKDIYARVEPLNARELVASQALQSSVNVRITIRYRPGLDSTMRIRHKDKIYNPLGVIPDKDSGLEFLVIPCSEGPSKGL